MFIIFYGFLDIEINFQQFCIPTNQLTVHLYFEILLNTTSTLIDLNIFMLP